MLFSPAIIKSRTLADIDHRSRTVETLFQALSACSALHASLMPNGEPSSFFGSGGFGDDDDDDEGEDGQWDDAEDPDADANGAADGTAGRVRSDFHSGGGPGARFRPY